jgi:hypothetical protein
LQSGQQALRAKCQRAEDKLEKKALKLNEAQRAKEQLDGATLSLAAKVRVYSTRLSSCATFLQMYPYTHEHETAEISRLLTGRTARI